ncbi:CASC3/Barentsz eIF4AIII binding-domain-containing protein [Sordaria brevicollis]|uniref:CASC3/Barentsz eIF4AIII binding-domain-containing protein n=1 Tax=Sordaria brevicollis TaxID=83679 RepID=A0AAE0U5V6_SORBR|nr:CASC3/Barentsz eIF4AIII binding-domain-containing protein [Sordaria brevicollis]
MASTHAPRRRKVIGQRRRVEDEGEEEGPDALDLDDDSVTEGSIASDDHDLADNDSDTSNVDEVSPSSPKLHKHVGNGAAKAGTRRRASDTSAVKSEEKPTVTDTEIMLHGLSLANKDGEVEEVDFDEAQHDEDAEKGSTAKDSAAPVVVSSSSVAKQSRVPPHEQKRRSEHEEYRRKRDEDPTFVPNRGAFFLHDHRHAGPAANGFRPFTRPGRGRGGGRGGGPVGLFTPMNPPNNPADPTTSGPWAHDMHEEVAGPRPQRQQQQPRYMPDNEGPPNGNGVIHNAPLSNTHINRAMSCVKTLGNVTVRVFIPNIGLGPKTFPGISLKQYTKLPDHRPPLRRDKPVRISIPDHSFPVMPRYIFPAADRSFIFIPRALRPNNQRGRGKGPRSVYGSIGGFSRRTSVFGGSYYGSAYSPSIAMSRRSSIGRDFMMSPTGSVISRPPLPVDANRPVVRLPPHAQQQPTMIANQSMPMMEPSINNLPQPQTHPLPQKPAFQDGSANALPIHQPRPQQPVSVENIEMPAQPTAAAPPAYQQAFHQQVPPQLESHARNPSFQSQVSTTPLSQIPERAIHAAPFQPNNFAQPGFYAQPVQMMPPQQGYYYPQGMGADMQPNAAAPAFIPGGVQMPQQMAYTTSGQVDPVNSQAAAQNGASQGPVAQEINGMVYYYDPNTLPAMVTYPQYPTAGPTYGAPVGMGGMMAPGPDAFYYQQPQPGMVYYAQ